MTDGPQSAFEAYIRAFETLDPEPVLPFYHLPCMFIAPQGVFTALDTDAARTLLSRFMGQLRSQSYRRTEVLGLAVRALSPTLASCVGTFVRFNSGDHEMARLGFTYLMRHSGAWQIIVAAVYEPIAA